MSLAALRGRTRRSVRMMRSWPLRAGGAIVAGLLLVAATAPLLAPYDPSAQDVFSHSQPPTFAHWLGTDRLGRDTLSRMLYGGRVSLTVSVGAVFFGLATGVAAGLIAGFFGGFLDAAMMRIVDVLLAFPIYLLAIFVIAILGPSPVNTLLAIGVASFPRFARLVRGDTRVQREASYVEAARGIGAGDLRLMFVHVLPNILAPVIVTGSLLIGSAILVEASLSFLGLGLPPPTPAWGLMVSDGLVSILSAPWISIFPGLAITLAVLGFNMLGDGLRDALDPRFGDVR